MWHEKESLMQNSKVVLMDLTSLNGAPPHRHLKNLVWPTSYSSYTGIAEGLIETILARLKDIENDETSCAILRAKSYDIISDISLIVRLAMDISTSRRAGLQLVYNPKSSPLLTYLDVGADLHNFPIPRIWHHPINHQYSRKLTNIARRFRSRLLSFKAGPDRIDVHNKNNLVNAFLQDTECSSVDWPVANVDWCDGTILPKELTETAVGLSHDFLRLAESRIAEKALAKKLQQLSCRLITFHLSKAYSDLLVLEKHLLARPMGSILLSGTPKHLGRLAGWLYRRDGQTTIRCAHGGERAFFVDFEWGLAEFPDCDIYYTHGTGEREALERRISSSVIPTADQGGSICFRSLGSPHHQNIYNSITEQRQAAKTGEILYVAGGYLGEAFGDFTNRKPPDTLYLDWQIDLLQKLKQLGYKVTLKSHPGGIVPNEKLLSFYTDKFVKGIFDPTTSKADCFLFDFAGTAFVDALASGRPMVLADMGVRPFDTTTFEDLSSRCPVTLARVTEDGKFRVDAENLGNAIVQSIETDPNSFSDFHRKFFEA
jgi:hypothetical protein